MTISPLLIRANGPHRHHRRGVRGDRRDAPARIIGYEARLNAKGERLIWVEASVVDRLAALRGPGESYSDVILRLVEIEAGSRS